MITRDAIERALRQLNAAENARPTSSIEETSAKIDKIFAVDVQGWWNGVHVPNREAERAGERRAFSAMPDYHREVERLIIEPPKAAMGWTIRGTVGGRPVTIPGASIFEFDENGLVRRYWGFVDSGKFASSTQ